MCVAETIVPYNRQGCFDEMVKLVTDDVSGIIKQVIDAIPGVDQGTVNDIMSFLNYASLCGMFLVRSNCSLPAPCFVFTEIFFKAFFVVTLNPVRNDKF